MPIKVMLIDDHTLFRQGLIKLLESHHQLEVTGQAGNAAQAFEVLRTTVPDVIVTGVKMPGMDGVQCMEQIRKTLPQIKFVFLSMYEDAAYVLRALRAGASGYVLKSWPVERLIDTIVSVQNSQKSRLNLSLDRDVLLAFGGIGASSKNNLSHQERKVLQLLAGGLSNKAIGESMFLSEQTVKGYIHNILGKLDASDRTHAAVIGVRQGLLD